jgi:hypothetical protein
VAVGTSYFDERIAPPLSEQGVRVHGIDLSPDRVQQLKAKPGADAIEVTKHVSAWEERADP